MDVSHLDKGMYLLIFTSNQYSIAKKIVISCN
nr:T9SS type A sorting domain-containing protein [Bacteroidota bacterium]